MWSPIRFILLLFVGPQRYTEKETMLALRTARSIASSVARATAPARTMVNIVNSDEIVGFTDSQREVLPAAGASIVFGAKVGCGA